MNGVNGTLFTGPNGKTMFLPATGYRNENYTYEVGSLGWYWSRLIDTGDSSYAYSAYNIGIAEGCWYTGYQYRSSGQTVRAVRVSGN